MKKKYFWSLLTFMLVAMLSVGFASCGGDDEDDNESNYNMDKDPEGTILVNISNDGYSSVEWYRATGTGFSIPFLLLINEQNNFTANGGMIVSVGTVNGISKISRIPETGWVNTLAVIPGNGYVLYDEYSGISAYARVFVVDYIYNISGGIIGATIKYQVWNPNSK